MLRPQVTLPTAPMMALRNQTPGRIMVGQQQVQLKELQPGEASPWQRHCFVSVSFCIHVVYSVISPPPPRYPHCSGSTETRGGTCFQASLRRRLDTGTEEQAERSGWHFQVRLFISSSAVGTVPCEKHRCPLSIFQKVSSHNPQIIIWDLVLKRKGTDSHKIWLLQALETLLFFYSSPKLFY